MSERRNKAKHTPNKTKQKAKAAETAAAMPTAAAAEQAAENASDRSEAAKDKARQMGEAESNQYGCLSHDARSAYSHGRHAGTVWEQDFESYVRRRPLTMVIAGLGVGFLLGLAWVRKK